MKDKDMSFSNEYCLTFDSLNQLSIISIIEKANILWAIKDNNSKFVYLNESCLDLFNI